VGEITWKNKYLAINSEGKRTCGRSRHGWKDNKEPFGELLVDCDDDFSISGTYEWFVASQE
jgi:hypothetical protein